MPMTPNDRGLCDPPSAEAVHVETHESASGIEAPIVKVPHGALLQRIDDGEAEAGERDHDDEEDRDRCGDAGHRADLVARDIRERPAFATD